MRAECPITERLHHQPNPWYRGLKVTEVKKIFLFILIITVLALTEGFARAQQAKKVPRIGILALGSGNPLGLTRRGTDAFQQALHELGWLDGKNIVLEYRWANENEDRLFELVAELVRINVDIILVTTIRAANAAKKLTKTFPIVVTVIP